MVPDRGGDPTFVYRLAEVVYLEEKGAAPAGSMSLWGRSRPANGSDSSTNSTPTAGCQSRFSDRLFSVAPAYASPKRAAKAAALGFAPAGATENRKWEQGRIVGLVGGAKSEYQSGPNPVDKRIVFTNVVNRSHDPQR